MTTLASSSQIILRHTLETQFGVTPTTGTHKRIPLTGESLSYEIEKVESEEINPSRGVSDMTAVSSSAAGSINFEMKASAYDDFIEAALQGTWQPQAVSGEVTITPTTMEFVSAPDLVPGQFFGLRSLPESSPNRHKIFRVESVAGSTVTLSGATPGVSETATAELASARLVNGSVRRSFSVEKEFSDVGIFRAFRGMNVSGFTLNASQGSLTTGEVSFMGRSGGKSTQSSSLPATETPLQVRRSMSGMTGSVCGVWVDGEPLIGTFVQSVSLTVDNNMRQQNAMCAASEDGSVPGAVGIGNGKFNANASLEVFFTQADTLYSEFVENRNVEFAFTAFDTEGHGYVFTLKKANVSNNQANASGGDQDVIASIELAGLIGDEGVVLEIDRISF